MGGAWQQALQKGLSKWCSVVGPVQRMRGVDVLRLRPSCPLLLLSGCTPGQFYHSHPHVPAEFDHLNFEMESQVFANIETIRKIGDAVQDHCDEIPFNIASMDWRKKPQVLQWVSNNGNGFAANAKVCGEATAQALAVHGMEDADMLGTFEVGDNVSDRRFLLETFAMFGLEGNSLGPERKSIRIDLKDEFDAQFFMPYVPGYLIAGEADLAVFSLTAASGEESVPRDGSQQVELLLEKLLEVLADLGASFEDVTLTWNRVADLSADEEAVLMTRSKKGLHRPLAESVLGRDGQNNV
ncbi:unnamed protein product [Polarella glacialis]|uniref:Uncharacterized protein n=1 Tax=Polarella glacialis TaxID=89957 RepID=A0A813LK78_POLGL|nr:unnamed protein product [Polarella glacialis]